MSDRAVDSRLTAHAGLPYPMGATVDAHAVNFAVSSRHATGCVLVIFDRGALSPRAEISFAVNWRVGDVWCMRVEGLSIATFEYGFRMMGAHAPAKGHWFDDTKVLLDPYAPAIGGLQTWRQRPLASSDTPYRSRLIDPSFDWGEGPRHPDLPTHDLIIYETHVRGFTAHPSSLVTQEHAGTFAGLAEKIPYLRSLGVNCVELLPIMEFDELQNRNVHPDTGEPLLNYWGYDTLLLFAPKASYAASGESDGQAAELKAMVRALHEANIEVILDVVYNHTAESDREGPTLSYRGLDNRTYYMLDECGEYRNFSGCGNTFNANHPVVRNLILASLRHWVTEYRIDGFRFDLASILTRGVDGEELADPPLIEAISLDPILAGRKLIAEAWDAAGLYQVGRFPSYGRWIEWNGIFRDSARKFLRAEEDQVAAMSECMAASPGLYSGVGNAQSATNDNPMPPPAHPSHKRHEGATASVNFIIAHDGFTLHDLVSYDSRHNRENGEQGRDGGRQNYSWNCGVEGPTGDPAILGLRTQQMKNAMAILMLAQGIPMFMMGDEMARTQYGNNNPYCHDDPKYWLNWSELEMHGELWTFTQAMIAFRKRHPMVRHPHFLPEAESLRLGSPNISWHGVAPWRPDRSHGSRTMAYMLTGPAAAVGSGAPPESECIYVAMNTHWEGHSFTPPELPSAMAWDVAFSTATPVGPGEACFVTHNGDGAALEHLNSVDLAPSARRPVEVPSRSVMVLVGRTR